MARKPSSLSLLGGGVPCDTKGLFARLKRAKGLLAPKGAKGLFVPCGTKG